MPFQNENIQKKRRFRFGSERMKPAEHLGDVLAGLMSEGYAKRHGDFESLMQAWCSVVPAEVAEHCRIVELSAGRLKVAVDSPAHLQQLRLSGAALKQELAGLLPKGALKDIIFLIG